MNKRKIKKAKKNKGENVSPIKRLKISTQFTSKTKKLHKKKLKKNQKDIDEVLDVKPKDGSLLIVGAKKVAGLKAYKIHPECKVRKRTTKTKPVKSPGHKKG